MITQERERKFLDCGGDKEGIQISQFHLHIRMSDVCVSEEEEEEI